MKNLTRIQKTTLVLLFFYGIWEIAVWIWSKSLPDGDPVIRADLFLIYPVILVFIIISIIQFIKNKK